MKRNYEISELKQGGYYQITSKDLAGEIVADVHASAIYSGKAEAEYICKAVNNHEELLNWCHKLYAVLFTSGLLDHKEMDALQTAIKNAAL